FVFGVASSRWNNLGADWGNPSNWANGIVPDSSYAHADLIDPLPAGSSGHVVLNGDHTIGHLALDHGYTIDPGTPGSTLTLGKPFTDTFIDVLGGNHTINARLLLDSTWSPTDIDVAAGA